ncbi:MAG: PEP-CTERM sorting domain-containing protein, partial [Microcystis aeruginosa]
LLAIGSFGALGAALTLKRKLKSSKTSENETTKVG